MTQITLAGCEPRTLLSHMALYGLGAILEAGGARDVRLGWAGTATPGRAFRPPMPMTSRSPNLCSTTPDRATPGILGPGGTSPSR